MNFPYLKNSKIKKHIWSQFLKEFWNFT